jgi:TrmH family RNA methyltransferase
MMDEITSQQNDRVKLVRALQSRARTRRKEGLIVLEGARLVRDAIQHGQRPEFVFYESQSADSDLIALLEHHGIQPVPVSPGVMRHMVDTQQPQGVVAVFTLPNPPLPQNPQHLLILDGIRDPGNLGTILRTAAATGVDAVILSSDSADPYNPKALRGGMGAHFRVPVIEAEWDTIARHCRGLAVYLADSHAETAYDDVDWSDGWAVIIGSEAHGAGSQAAILANARICIPLAAETESLNAAVAAGVILFEAQRKRPAT